MKPLRVHHLPYEIDEESDRHHYYENHWKRVALALLARHAGDVKDWSFLDYGCGRGESLAYAASMGMVPFGLDSDPRCVALSQLHGKAEILDLAHPERQVQPSSFDVVACFHVLEHVENPKRVLTMLGKAARRYVLIAVPNLQKIPNLRKPRTDPSPTNPGHLQSWDHSHFRNLAETHCGLELISWANDATMVPFVSEFVRRLLGNKAVIRLESGPFRRMFPFWGISIIALLRPRMATQ